MFTRLILWSLALLFTLNLSAQTIKPYLQTPTPHSVWINWKTATPGMPTVFYGATPGNLSQSVNGTTASFSDPNYSGGYFYRSVNLTGLTPSTGYYYQVRSGSDSSEIHYFSTPAPYDQAPDKVRILVLGDHQIRNQPRYDSMVVAAKRKMEELYGSPIADHVDLIMNAGDQVDLGNLDHYENIHFKKSSYISPDLPIMPAVGNHETYGALGMGAYYDHFILDGLSYRGISSGTENYYAYQMANTLFLVLSTEHTTNAQTQWARRVIDSVKTDPNVDWLFVIGHRPYQAEQYIGDISYWVIDDILPMLKTTDKFAMFIGAHHHIYSRGQFEDFPAYHIISGGTAWNQYWGMSTERDFAETQKTLPEWAYQLIEIDNATQRMNVSCYSIGSIYRWKNNLLVDTFYLQKGLQAPLQPTLTNTFGDSLQLPLTLESTPFNSPSTQPLNSTQFQISQFEDFTELEMNVLRDFENYYGMKDGEPDSTANLNEGIDLMTVAIDTNSLANGMHYVRVRHRDQNLQWSDWSATDSFKVYGSVVGEPGLFLDKKAYGTGEVITATYRFGPGNPTDWVALYPKGATPGTQPATAWQYVDGRNGTLSFTLYDQNEYEAVFLEDDGFVELAPRVPFWVGRIPELTSDTSAYPQGMEVPIRFSSAPGGLEDWIGVYKVGYEPGSDTAYAARQDVSGPAGAAIFDHLPKGYYYATYHVNDGYFEPGSRFYFSVGDTIAAITTDKTIYNLGEELVVYFSDGPGTPKDWLGIYEANADPNIDYLYSYVYVNGRAAGDTLFSDIDPNASNILPDSQGDYFVVLFINDSYNEVSNRVYFSIADSATSIEFFDDTNPGVKLYPNPVRDYAVLDAKYPIHQVTVHDLHGRTVMMLRDLQSEQVQISRENLPPGVYLLSVYSNKVYQFKLKIE